MKLLSRYVTLRRRRVQILVKGLADAGGKAVMLAITVVAARQLNPDPFAVLAFAMTTGWLLGVATDAGLSMHLARETVRDVEHRGRLWLEVLTLRAGLAFTAATAVALFSPLLVPAHWKRQFLLVVLVQLTSATTETIAHYFRGLGRSEIEAAVHAAQRGTTLVLGLAVLWWFRRLDYLAIAMLVPAAAALFVSIAVAHSLNALNVRLKPDATSAGEGPVATSAGEGLSSSIFFRDVLPLGAGVLISALYFRIDVYFIQYWHGLQPVGGYNAAFRLIEAMRLVPAAALAVTFPLLVQAGDTRAVQRLGGGLAAVGGVLAIGCALGAPLIMPLAYGEHYGYAAPAFAILALALPLFFLNYALTHQVIGWDGQRAYLLIAMLALAGNIAANVLLVPSRGIAGAAIATVVTELIVTAGCVYTLVRHERSTRRFITGVQHEGSSKVQREGSSKVRHEGSSKVQHEGSPKVQHEGSSKVQHEGSPV